MYTHRGITRYVALLLAFSLVLPLAACGGKNTAATMHLRKTEGSVGVSDGAGKDIEPRENLGLYSGYGVDTRSASYAWIDLDSAKLTKMDQDSAITITKDGKLLEIEVISGSLFFNVTEPLADDETMNIRTSTMMVGIRGTCGWVEAPDDGSMKVFLLEGRVRCTVNGEHKTVRAGEMAVMTEDGEITVSEFTANDIPTFVLEEIEEDEELAQTIPSSPGNDEPEPEEPAGPLAAYAGEYTLYSAYGGGRWTVLTLDANGVVTGHGTPTYPLPTDGMEPISITVQEDGVIEMVLSEDESYILYPPGVEPAWFGDAFQVNRDVPNLRYLHFAGGVMDVLYYCSALDSQTPSGPAEPGAIPADLVGVELASWWSPRSGYFVEFQSDRSFRYRSQDVGFETATVTTWDITVDRVEQTGGHSYALHIDSISGETTTSNLANNTSTTSTPDSGTCPYQPGDTIQLVLPGASASEVTGLQGTFNSGSYYINGREFNPY